MSTEKRRHSITNGPGKFDLMSADYDNSPSHPRFVTFGVEDVVAIYDKNHKSTGEFLPAQPCNVCITGTDRQDKTGDKRFFRGYTTDGGCFKKDIQVEGFIDLTTRKGWIEF